MLPNRINDPARSPREITIEIVEGFAAVVWEPGLLNRARGRAHAAQTPYQVGRDEGEGGEGDKKRAHTCARLTPRPDIEASWEYFRRLCLLDYNFLSSTVNNVSHQSKYLLLR